MLSNDEAKRQIRTIMESGFAPSFAGLAFWPELGIGYYPVDESPYDSAYFDKYKAMAETPMGKAITQFRVGFVNCHWDGELIDVGIGSGAFITERIDSSQNLDPDKSCTYGFDINPKGVDWLDAFRLFRSPYQGTPAVSMWDVMEHIHEPWALLDHVRDFVFISIPIFRDAYHVLRSKHFRKDEHCWYFTEAGLVFFMGVCGFSLADRAFTESELGREDIGTYAFRRIRNRIA